MKLPLFQEISYPTAGVLPTAFAGDGRSVLLESAERAIGGGRYSYLLWDPFWTIRWGFDTGWRSESGPSARSLPDDPWAGVEAALTACPVDDLLGGSPAVGNEAPLAPFAGGAAGYFGYELAATLETLPELARRATAAPPARWALGDVVVALDHAERRAFLVSHGWPAAGRSRERRAHERSEEAAAAWSAALAADPPAQPPLPERREDDPSLASALAAGLRVSLSYPEYASRFARLHAYLEEGHVYQANLSLAFRAEVSLPTTALYEAMRRQNPAPYAACLPGQEASVLSASPELFLRRRGSHLVTRPIKGTRPRGATPAEDQQLAEELRQSAKDHAEHVMIVDVHRNDLGRVARFGSVQVPEPWVLESFASVHHLTSTIEAELLPGKRLLDAVRAAFPAGSITGAPKVRAMEILADLEPHARGPYTGALGWIAPGGDFDLAVGIRTLTHTENAVEFPAGGGIVLDSTPEREYEEAWDKARATWRAVCAAAARPSAPSPAVPAGAGS